MLVVSGCSLCIRPADAGREDVAPHFDLVAQAPYEIGIFAVGNNAGDRLAVLRDHWLVEVEPVP